MSRTSLWILGTLLIPGMALAAPAASSPPSSEGTSPLETRPLETRPLEAVHVDRPQRAVWAAPLATGVTAAVGLAYVPIGIDLPIRSRTLALEATLLHGGWYACSTSTTGASLSVGMHQPFSGHDALQGFFWEPLILARYYSTYGGIDQTGWFPCSATILRGSDGEVSLGLNIGYQVSRAHFYLAFALGARAGLCLNCVTGGILMYGPLELFPDPEARATRFGVGVDIDLVRVGAAF